MITLSPVRRALVPIDSAAAARISAPNYDEFQSDDEIRALIRDAPESVLRITMPHCDPASEVRAAPDAPPALAEARAALQALAAGPMVRTLRDVLYVYRIEDPARPGKSQTGLGGMARTREIRTGATPTAPIIRNEGIHEYKARGRARLIEATSAFIGTVNCAVPDTSGEFAEYLEAYVSAHPADYQARDARGCTHQIRLVTDAGAKARLLAFMAAQPEGYVADGNHRSAAALMLGSSRFLAVFFPLRSMALAPYNRLVRDTGMEDRTTLRVLRRYFRVESASGPVRPSTTHEIGLRTRRGWHRLTPLPGYFDVGDPVECIDANIVQRRFFGAVLGISDPRDPRLTFVGGDRDVDFLQAAVSRGDYRYAVTLAPVTLGQFQAVCRASRIMPPKSTWFQPKIRSGLVMALEPDRERRLE